MPDTQSTISSSLEDYLEAIAGIIDTNGHAHTKDIAEKLDVTMPSVSNALQSLAARDLIVYHPHQPVKLTSSGAEKAAVIRRRHQTLKHFFAELLKLEGREPEQTACRIEHVIGETVLSRLAVLAEAIGEREDCAGLREYLAQTMPQIHPDSVLELVSLEQLPTGRQGVISRVADNLRGIKKFADLGLVPGTLITKEGRAPFGDLLRVRVMGSVLSLRGSDARYIWLKPME